MNKNNGCKFKLVDKNKKRKSIGYKETYQKKKKKQKIISRWRQECGT